MNTRYKEAASDTSYVMSSSGSVEVFTTVGARRRRRHTISHGQVVDPQQQKAYRIHFSVASKSRYFRGCKRSIRWVFGIANSGGFSRKDYRGEEHEVELVWTTKKKRAKVYWNKCNVSNFLRQQEISENAEFSWKICSGETLHIVSKPVVESQAMIQYDLLVDGVSFFHLPKARDLGRAVIQVEDQRSPDDESARPNISLLDDTDQWDCQSDAFALPPPTDSLGFRLSMAGLSSSTSFNFGDKIQDELHSELYTPVLEPLRLQITSYLPQTEEMVSRAIINAFFVDSNSLRSDDSSRSDRTKERLVTDPHQVEVDYLLEAHKWVKTEADHASLAQHEELALRFFQKQVDNIFVHIRNEELTSDEAARILFSVAAVLGLKFAHPGIPRDTVILNGLDNETTKESLRQSLAEYGQVVDTAIAKESSRFGLCRFAKLETVTRVWDAYRNGSFAIGKSKPAVASLGEEVYGGSNLSTRMLSSVDEKVKGESVSSPKPSAVSTPHLMAPLSLEDPWLTDSPVSVVRYVVTEEVGTNEKKRDRYGRSSTPASSDSGCFARENLLWAP